MIDNFVKLVLKISFISVIVLAAVFLVIAGFMIFNPKLLLSVIHYAVIAFFICAAVYLIVTAVNCIKAGSKEK